MITVLAACSSSDSKHKPSSGPSGTGQAAGPTACDGYTKGQHGVINVYCGGGATAKGTIGSDEFDLDKGSCLQGATFLSVNVGILVGPDFAGSPPDYFGLVLKPTPGPFTNASATIDADGTPHAVTVSGSLTEDLRSGKFTGTDGSLPVSGTFSC
jgi:hypothetical protein